MVRNLLLQASNRVCFGAFREAEGLYLLDIDIKKLEHGVIRGFIDALDAGVFVQRACFQRKVVQKPLFH